MESGPLRLKGLGNAILRRVDLDVAAGEVRAIVGPTGAGKTTLLNAVAGLVDAEGSITSGDAELSGRPARDRGVGFLHQDDLLFPHMTVRKNVAFGLTRRSSSKESGERVDRMLALVRLSQLAHRYPRLLSGGEKKRVALARALAPSPALLLLDEPFASLDRETARLLRLEFRELQERTAVTTLFVTHDLEEMEEVAHQVSVMCDGALEQTGSPRDILFNPASDKVRDFAGRPNILHVDEVTSRGDAVVEVVCGSMKLVVPAGEGALDRVAVLPRNVYLSDVAPPGPPVNRFQGEVVELDRASGRVRARIDISGQVVEAEMAASKSDQLGLLPGMPVHVILRLKHLRTD